MGSPELDTGVGIPPEDLPHIFERFYRGDPARARPGPDDRVSSGSGLGLAIVKGLVEATDGGERRQFAGRGDLHSFSPAAGIRRGLIADLFSVVARDSMLRAWAFGRVNRRMK